MRVHYRDYEIPAGINESDLTIWTSSWIGAYSNFYNKEFEGGILYNDSSLDIPWNTNKPIVSAKDLSLPKFGEHKTI